jgi:hypothetical protein
MKSMPIWQLSIKKIGSVKSDVARLTSLLEQALRTRSTETLVAQIVVTPCKDPHNLPIHDMMFIHNEYKMG